MKHTLSFIFIVCGFINIVQAQLSENTLQKTKLSQFSVQHDSGLLFGLKNQAGEIIVAPEYKIMNPTHAREYYILSKDKMHYGVIDGYGNRILQENLYSKVTYTGDVFVCKKTTMYGIMSKHGEELLPFIYSDVEIVGDYLTLTLNGKCAVYDCQENIFLTAFTYSSIGINNITVSDSSRNKFSQFYYYTAKNQRGLMDWYNLTDNKMIDSTYSAIFVDYNTHMFIVKKQNKYGLADRFNNIRIPITYDKIKSYYSRNSFIAQKDNKYGVLGIDNTIKVDFIYDKFWNYSETDSLYYTANKNQYGLININQLKEVLPCIYSDIYIFNKDSILVRKEKLYGIINQNQKLIHPFSMKMMIDTLLIKYTAITMVYTERRKYGLVSCMNYLRYGIGGVFTTANYDQIYALGTFYKYYVLAKGHTFELYKADPGLTKEITIKGYDSVVSITKNYIVVNKSHTYKILGLKDGKELTQEKFDQVEIDKSEKITVVKDGVKSNLLFNTDGSYVLKKQE